MRRTHARTTTGTGPEQGDHTHGLESLGDAVRYRRYLAELMTPYCGPSVLEVGAGLGDFTEHLVNRERVIATDADPECVRILKERFGHRREIEVMQLDCLEPPSIDPPVDTVVGVNVLEHIQDDRGALANLATAVRPGGSVVIFVPGYESLYGPFDVAVGHERRYTPASLRAVAEGAGLTVEVCHPVNLLGGVAWWFAVRLGRQTRPRSGLVRLYDRLLVPIVRLMERRWKPPFGQSILCVARVPGHQKLR